MLMSTCKVLEETDGTSFLTRCRSLIFHSTGIKLTSTRSAASAVAHDVKIQPTEHTPSMFQLIQNFNFHNPEWVEQKSTS